MKTSLRFIGFAVGFSTLALTGAFAQQPAFSIQLVSTFDYPGTGNLTRPQKISDKGDVVGIYLDTAAVSRGFVMFANGSFSPPLVDPNDTGSDTEGRGINNSRLVCGDYLDSASGTFHGFFFTHNSYQNYDVPDSTTTILLGLNNIGDFCGSETPTGGIQSGFLSIGGTITEFAVPNATATLAYQLNSTNQSCGYYLDAAGVSHGFFRDSSGRLHAPIDPEGSTNTILFGNNDANLIVGRYADASGLTHGILFMPPNRFVVYDFPGSGFTSLNGINRNNEIVGRYTDSATLIDHGIIAKVVRTAGSVTLPLAAAAKPVPAVPQRVVDSSPAN